MKRELGKTILISDETSANDFKIIINMIYLVCR